jgi:hypothetical protein
MYSKKDLRNRELINEVTEAAMGKAPGCPKGMDRGAWLHKELGLDKVKTIRKRSSGIPTCIDEADKSRELQSKAYEIAKKKNWNLIKDDFTIDENFNFTHTSWKGVFCKGGDTVVATIEIINRYINECNKPYGKRDLSFIHLA